MRRIGIVSVVALIAACPDAGSVTGVVDEPDTTSTTSAPDDTASPTSTGHSPTTHAFGDTEDPGDTTSSSTSSSTSNEDTSGSSTGAASVCGDGVVEGDEQCDDGDLLPDDGCSPACEIGPGAALPPVEPEIGPYERLFCLAIVDKQHLGGATHALTLGSEVAGFGPEGQVGGHVRQMPLAGGASSWAHLEYAGIYGRRPLEATTMSNGDVVVAGLVWKEDVQVDSGGHLWLARFTPAGQVVWSHDREDVMTMAYDMAVTSDGDIVFAGHTAGFSTGNLAHRFRGSDGALVWSYLEPQSMTHSGSYTGMTLDADDNVYIVGFRGIYAEPPVPAWAHVRALDPDGAERWELEHEVADQNLIGRTITVTTDEQLIVGATQYVDVQQPTTTVLLGIDLDGALLWSRSWSPDVPQEIHFEAAVPDASGGLYVTGLVSEDLEYRRIAARFDATGHPAWVNAGGEGYGRDIEVDPDGIVHVLTPSAVVAYLP